MGDEERNRAFREGGSFDRSGIFNRKEHQQCAECNKITEGKYTGKMMGRQVHYIDESGEGHTEQDVIYHQLPYNTGHGMCEDCIPKWMARYRVVKDTRKEQEERQRAIEAQMAERDREYMERSAAGDERNRQVQAAQDERQRAHEAEMAARYPELDESE